MAKFLSQVYTSIRGKVGGIVYTKNQYAGLVARSFTAPTNPGTEGQAHIRSCFDESSAIYQLLTPAERTGWDDYAKTCLYPGPHGPYSISGRAMFMACYALAKFIETFPGSGSTIVADKAPPTVAGFVNIGPVQNAAFTPPGDTGISISVGNPNAFIVPYIWQRSIGWNQTKNIFRGPYNYGDNIMGDLALSATSVIDQGGLTADVVYFTRFHGVTAAPHRLTAPYTVRHIAATNP